jgi:predicted xylose isomerase-like sugar epimerase
MLKLKELLKLVVLKVLISGVKKCALCRKFVLPDRRLLKVKQVMKNYIQVQKTSMLQHRPFCFYKDNQHERPSKQNHSPNRNESSRKN